MLKEFMQRYSKPEVIKEPNEENTTPGPEHFHVATLLGRRLAEEYISPPPGLKFEDYPILDPKDAETY